MKTNCAPPRFSAGKLTLAQLDRALKNIRMAGGKAETNEAVIPYQKPKAASMEQWDPGVPDRRVAWNDPAWIWKGNWREAKQEGNDSRIAGKIADGGGAEAEFGFSGTAVILIGGYSQSRSLYIQGGVEARRADNE